MPPLLPVVAALFAASGAAALIYEIVWLQLLQLVIGSTAVTLAVLLSTFMGGMCIGSLALPRLLRPGMHPLRVYAALEAAIAAAALFVLAALPLARGVYTSVELPGGNVLLRAVVAAVPLLPPTVLMGATLPAIARWVSATRDGVAWLGFFYGGNIAGAVAGCLFAGFYLLPRVDMATATFAGMALNLLAAGGAYVLAARAPMQVVAEPDASVPSRRRAAPAVPAGTLPIFVAIALSGMAALGAEVVWTRVLSLLFGATVYAFSIILAMFLLGLGIGSAGASFLVRRIRDARVAFGIVQLLLTAAIAWAAWLLGEWLPYWPLNPSQSRSAALLFQIDLLRSALTVLPAAILWGASFPLALAAVTTAGADTARVVGRLYAANTLGAIAGACGASLLAVQTLGTAGAQRLLVVIAAVAAALALVPPALSRGTASRAARPAFLLYAAAAVIILVRTVPEIPPLLIAYGRYVGVVITGQFKVLHAEEGMNASVAVTESADGVRNFHVSGKIEASNHPQDMPLQRLLGHLPALMHPRPASVLVVGFGAGVTAGSFVPYPDVRRITVAEIEPLIPRVVATHFRRENHDVARDARVRIVYDDGRHFVQQTRETFDIITSDPIHPWVKGSATLFTREYFALLKARLNPGGLVTQWIPLYESDADVVRSELATFAEVFPDAVIWANRQRGGGYDLVLLGMRDGAAIHLDAVRARLAQPSHAGVRDSLQGAAFRTPLAIFGTYVGRAADLRPWLAGAQINRDSSLRLQYLAGLQSNVYEGDAIYAAMRRYRSWPQGLFGGSPDAVAEVRALFDAAP